LGDLETALKSCKDTSPGPDGIPYLVYKRLWDTVGPYILRSWLHSVETGLLPPSHLESIITLLPKEGKDSKDIKNWRPITLSNCDLKIVTKALSNKVSKVLESIIDPVQTAYVPGRSVADNLRSNFYIKNKCNSLQQDAVLISLDAKKAFDSVDHKYIEETLAAYGFGPNFILVFKTLYNKITARILINGFTSEKINIERGVKQGDALSCAIFIICIDPLLRNLNKNKLIIPIRLNPRNTDVVPKNGYFKSSAYADDISVICKNSVMSIQQVFREYDRLTNKSGLELNADKTEILNLKSDEMKSILFRYNNQNFQINTVKNIKICGLFFCTNSDDEYSLNILNKIKKLKSQLKMWSHFHLTLEGKNLIVKTFGLSQLIYNLQSYGIRTPELTDIERTIFDFLWSKGDGRKGVDRIKRSIMKNEYSEGGINVTDIECLNRSLKLKQFIRAAQTNHPIAYIQQILSTDKINHYTVRFEYRKVTESEAICTAAHDTLNRITDYNRMNYQYEQLSSESKSDLLNEVSSINLVTYLSRKNKVFLLCIIKPLTSIGINSLGELVQAYEVERDTNLSRTMKIIINSIPKNLVEIVNNYDEYTINDCMMKTINLSQNNRKIINNITTKELQITLKKSLNKCELLNIQTKNRLTMYNNNGIVRFREQCKNVKLRSIFFRLIHNDFFTHERMKRYKMTNDDKCPRCGNIETSEHLLFECVHALKIWSFFNTVMKGLNNKDDQVTKYDEVFDVGYSKVTMIIKIKTIQILIQIDRPMNWTILRYSNKINEIIKLEMHSTLETDKRKNEIIWNEVNLFLSDLGIM
jgi:hypothetical protein